MFLGLIRSLLGSPVFEVDAHPNVWATAFDDPKASRTRLCLLNRPSAFPALPVQGVGLRVRPPAGFRFVSLTRIPTGEALSCIIYDDGSLGTELPELRVFEMLAANFVPSNAGLSGTSAPEGEGIHARAHPLAPDGSLPLSAHSGDSVGRGAV
jgi:hypothetical protein